MSDFDSAPFYELPNTFGASPQVGASPRHELHGDRMRRATFYLMRKLRPQNMSFRSLQAQKYTTITSLQSDQLHDDVGVCEDGESV